MVEGPAAPAALGRGAPPSAAGAAPTSTSQGGSGAKREMGPALRPTPLSPACGSRRGHFTPGAFNTASKPGPEGPSRCAASLSPGARAGAGSVGGWGMIARTCPLPPGGSATGLSKSLPRAAWHCPKTLPHLSMDFESPALSTLRPRGLNGLGFGSSEDVPLLIPPPRGISPSRRSGSKIPSPSLAFRPLPRKGQSPSR